MYDDSEWTEQGATFSDKAAKLERRRSELSTMSEPERQSRKKP